MIVHVYEVTKCYVVDIESTDKASALRDAVARVKRGEVASTPIDYSHIATLADSTAAPFDPRMVLRRLLSMPRERLPEVAIKIGKPDPTLPTVDRLAYWLVDLLTHARENGRMSELAAIVHAFSPQDTNLSDRP